MTKELACRKCMFISQGKVCPACGSVDLTENWKGLVVIFNVEKSEVATTLGVSKPGKYALQVS
jgi:DNA-directed RNA polymerase subunit E"